VGDVRPVRLEHATQFFYGGVMDIDAQVDDFRHVRLRDVKGRRSFRHVFAVGSFLSAGIAASLDRLHQSFVEIIVFVVPEGSGNSFDDVMAGERISHGDEPVSDLMANVGATFVSGPACRGTEATDDSDLTVIEQWIVSFEVFDNLFGRHVVFQKIHSDWAERRVDEGLVGECGDVMFHVRTVGTYGQRVGRNSHAEPSRLLASTNNCECHSEMAPDRCWVLVIEWLQHGEKSAKRKALAA
jgi:hypothetical protein